MKTNDSEPTLRKGLEKGYRESREMASTPEGRLIILVVLGSMFWLFFLAPAAWMKLEQIFPKTRIGFFVCLAMYFSWLMFFIITGIARRRMRNIRLFGKRPLKIDLLADLLLFPRLLLCLIAYEHLLSLDLIDRSQWKQAFEDLVNMGSIDIFRDRLSFDEEGRLAVMPRVRTPAPVANIAILVMFSQKHKMPIVFRDQDMQLLDPADSLIQDLKNRAEPIGHDKSMEGEPRSQIATWIFEMKLPRIFSRREKEGLTLLHEREEKIEEFALINPDELVSLLKDRTALSQLRNNVHRLAALDSSKSQVHNFIESERFTWKNKGVYN